MAEYLSPGVYVEEFNSGIKPMEGVSTSTVGFVGMTERGPVRGTPEFVGSFGEFQRIFGGYLPESYGDRRFLPMAVEQFFANGGSRCFIVRLLKEDGTASAKLTAGPISFTAASPGAWGNGLQVRCKKGMKDGLYTLTLIAGDGYSETYSDVSVSATDKNGIPRMLEKSLLAHAEITGSSGELLAAFKAALQTEDSKDPKTEAKDSKDETKEEAKDSKDENKDTGEEPKEGWTLNFSGGSDGTGKAGEKAGTAGAGAASEAGGTVEAGGTDETGGGSASAEEIAAHPAKLINAAVIKGEDGGPGNRTGLWALADIPEVSIVVAPGVTENAEVQEIITHCSNMQNRVCILDMPAGVNKVTALKEYRMNFTSSFAAMYHPWIQVFDPLLGKSVYMPPSGAMAGVYAHTDNTRGVFKAPANEVIRNCTGLETLFGKPEQDMLNPLGINLIRNIPGLGIRVWGARTLSDDSSWKYINVRRLFIYIEETIRRNTAWAVFEPNDQLLWTKVRGSIVSFLGTLWRDGALFGASESEAYFVNIGKGSTMTDDDILNGRLICVIGVAPVRPAEFVIFRITQIMEQNG